MTRQPGALRRMARASSAEIGLSNSILTASEWPMNTGTRTQVATSLIFGSRIFLVSATIFHSSLVKPSSMNTSTWGITLKAMRLGNFVVLISPAVNTALVWLKNSAMASVPAADTDWEVATTTRVIFAWSWGGL